MSLELQLTNDGSHTLKHAELQVTYHSVHGAVQESEHVFIQAGLRFALEKFDQIQILEIGFGTGLNALMSYREGLKHLAELRYCGIEKYPLPADITSLLNYDTLCSSQHRSVYENMHKLSWNEDHRLSERFVFRKEQADVLRYKPQWPLHLVYFDAFAPDAAPDLWQEPVFARLYEALEPGGCLVTFCAKGEVKRRLKSCGFKVEALPGPPGKREMTRAVKPL